MSNDTTLSTNPETVPGYAEALAKAQADKAERIAKAVATAKARAKADKVAKLAEAAHHAHKPASKPAKGKGKPAMGTVARPPEGTWPLDYHITFLAPATYAKGSKRAARWALLRKCRTVAEAQHATPGRAYKMLRYAQARGWCKVHRPAKPTLAPTPTPTPIAPTPNT